MGVVFCWVRGGGGGQIFGGAGVGDREGGREVHPGGC